MITDSLEKALACPVCGRPLHVNETQKSLLCDAPEKPHCFDIAARGYVNLICGRAAGGDDKACVASRTRFLDRGYYAPFAEAVTELAARYVTPGGILLDAGCGEGYYTTALARAYAGTVFGIDIAKPGLYHAAGRTAQAGLSHAFFAVASLFSLPLIDHSVAGILNLFAPCAEPEFDRVLTPDGILIVGAAGPRHLHGLKAALYDTPYENETRADLPRDLTHLETRSLCYDITLPSQEAIEDLFAMTPYYYRTTAADRAKLAALTSLTTEVDFSISVYRKNG